MQSFSYFAAHAKVRKLGGGVSEIVYSGPLGCRAFRHLRKLVLDATAGALSLVIRFDGSLDTMWQPPAVECQQYLANTAPASLIVRECQFDVWDAYSRQAAGQGVMRAVFLVRCAEQAYRWARASADARVKPQ